MRDSRTHRLRGYQANLVSSSRFRWQWTKVPEGRQLEYAEALAACKRHAAALTAAHQAVKYDLDHATSYLALGWYAYRCSDYEEAIVASRIALELDPTLAAAAFNLGLFHLAKHELDEARLMYNRAVAICEKMPQVDVELLLKSALEDIEELATNNQALALEAGELIKKLSKTSSVVVQQIRYTWPASKICI